MHGHGEIFGVLGVLGVFAALLRRERVPKVRHGFVSFVIRDFARSRRSARPGLLVEFSEQCDVARIVAPAGLALHDEIPLFVDADPVRGGDARVVSGEGARGA